MKIEYSKQVLIHILLLSLTTGCPSPRVEFNEAKQAVDYNDNLFGMAFTHQSINEGTDLERRIAQSVVYISTGDGSMGTGTFISPDGRILTNEHVVPRGTCAAEAYCKNIRVIRGFYPGGPLEVFDKVKVIAHRTEYADVAVLQVDTGGRTVPYVEEASDDEVKGFIEKGTGQEVILIGHPFGGTLRKSKTTIRDYDYDYYGHIRLDTVAISGNSGSAVIDPASGKIVGLYYASTWDKDSTALTTGRSRRSASASALSLVRRVVGLDSLAKSTPKAKSRPLAKSQILIAPVLEEFTNVDTIDKLAAQFVNVAESLEERRMVLNKFHSFIQEMGETATIVESFMGRVLTRIRYTKIPSKIAQDEIKKVFHELTPKSFDDDSKRFWRLSSVLGKREDRKKCLEKYKDSKTYRPITVCYSPVNQKGDKVKELYTRNLARDLVDYSWTLDELTDAVSVIQMLNMHWRTTKQEREMHIRILFKIMSMNSNANLHYTCESLILFFEQMPGFLESWEVAE